GARTARRGGRNAESRGGGAVAGGARARGASNRSALAARLAPRPRAHALHDRSRRRCLRRSRLGGGAGEVVKSGPGESVERSPGPRTTHCCCFGAGSTETASASV